MRLLLELDKLPPHHKDPFDRLLIAQSRVEDVPLLTVDDVFHRYPVRLAGRPAAAISTTLCPVSSTA